MDRPLSEQDINQQKRNLWLKGTSLVLLVAVIFYAINWFFTPSVNREKLRTSKVSMQKLTATINAGGLVVPLVEETLSSEISSQVSQVFLGPGQQVKKGQPILQLDTQKLNLAADKTIEKIALKNSQIKTKQLVTRRSINDVKSRIELLTVDLQSRKTKQQRLNQLTSVGAFSNQELLEADLNVKRTEIEIRQLNQSMSDLESTNKAETETLSLEKSMLEKELAEQHRLISRALITATRDGVVSWLKQDEGSSVALGEPLAKIVDDSQFRIEATLSDFYSSQLIPNMMAQITYQDKTMMGRLTQQTPTIENGIMKLSITLDQPDNSLLKNNLRVDVGLITKTVDQTLALSKGPFISGRGIQNVFVIRDQIAYRTEIEVGLSDANIYQIINGLNENDEVIISDMSDFIHLKEFAIN
jgi:HlyD family secretion protein